MPTCSWPACHCTHAKQTRNSLFLPHRCLQHLLLHRAIPHMCPSIISQDLDRQANATKESLPGHAAKHSSLRREIVAAPSPDSAPPKLARTMRAVQAKSPNLTALATCLLFGISQWRRRHRVGSNPQLALSFVVHAHCALHRTSLQPRITSSRHWPLLASLELVHALRRSGHHEKSSCLHSRGLHVFPTRFGLA